MLDDIFAMSYRIKFRLVLLVLLLITVSLCVGSLSINGIKLKYDAARLSIFAHRIAGADRVVGTRSGSSVSLTYRGDDTQKIVRAVSSAVSLRMPNKEFAVAYIESATFYKGTNVLGRIRMAGSLFLVGETYGPPFGSRLLEITVSTPLEEAATESWRTNYETMTTPPNN
jgi:hypothetical protein